MPILWILIFLMSAVIYALTIIFILPRFLLKNSYPSVECTDRGIAKYKDNKGSYAVVYEPEHAIKRFIKKYIIAERGGKKEFIYELREGIKYIDFDILLFDCEGNAALSLGVKNIVDSPEDIKPVELPSFVAYVSVAVNRVNDEEYENPKHIKVKRGRLAVFCIMSILVSVGFAIMDKLCISKLFGGLFRDDYFNNWFETLLVVLLTLLVSALISIICCVRLSRKLGGRKRRGKRKLYENISEN